MIFVVGIEFPKPETLALGPMNHTAAAGRRTRVTGEVRLAGNLVLHRHWHPAHRPPFLARRRPPLFARSVAGGSHAARRRPADCRHHSTAPPLSFRRGEAGLVWCEAGLGSGAPPPLLAVFLIKTGACPLLIFFFLLLKSEGASVTPEDIFFLLVLLNIY